MPDRQDYFQEPDFGAEYFRELMEDSGLRDLTMTLARGSVLAEVPMARLVAPQTPERLTLVACRRPADAVFVLDFGVANDDATPGIFAGVLRSWESRFGVLPVLLRSAWTAFQVLAPPSDETDVERLDSEVFAFAVDSGLQSGFFQRSQERRVSVQEMVQSREWLIWWD